MTTTTFVDGTTVIRASWLNDVNTTTYTTVPALAASNTGTNTGDQLTFKTISVSGQSDVVADTTTDTLTLVAGTGMTITTNASTDTVTLASATTTAATSTEVKTGTDNTKMVTPSNALAAFGFSGYFQSTDQTITTAGTLTIPHGLGRVPIMVQAFLKNTTTEANYAVGDITPAKLGNAANSSGCGITWNSTNILVTYGNIAGVFSVTDRTTGTATSITNTNWSFFVRVWA